MLRAGRRAPVVPGPSASTFSLANFVSGFTVSALLVLALFGALTSTSTPFAARAPAPAPTPAPASAPALELAERLMRLEQRPATAAAAVCDCGPAAAAAAATAAAAVAAAASSACSVATPSPCPIVLAARADVASSALPWQTDAPSDTTMPLPVALPSWLWTAGSGSVDTRVLSAADMAASHYLDHINAQDQEDQFLIERYFWARGGGIILESGALDGIRLSTSLIFEQRFGWKAVHVDANPRNYARLVVNRPDALNIHLAICQRPQLVHFLAEADPVVGVGTLKKAEVERLPVEQQAQGAKVQVGSGVGGIYEFMAPSFLRDFYPYIVAKGSKATDDLPVVACRPLVPVLRLFGIAHIHIWVLDVEGAELEVLKAVDFDAITIDVILVEADGGNPAKDAGVVSLLTSKGFLHEGNHLRSDWFVRAGFVRSAKPAV